MGEAVGEVKGKELRPLCVLQFSAFLGRPRGRSTAQAEGPKTASTPKARSKQRGRIALLSFRIRSGPAGPLRQALQGRLGFLGDAGSRRTLGQPFQHLPCFRSADLFQRFDRPEGT